MLNCELDSIRFRKWTNKPYIQATPRHRDPIDVHHHAGQVLEKERTENVPWKLQRLQAIRLAMEGRETYRRIAEIVRTTSSSLCKWIGWFRQGGMEELLGHANGAGGGKAPRFSPQQWERFRAELAKGIWRTARAAPPWPDEVPTCEIRWQQGR